MTTLATLSSSTPTTMSTREIAELTGKRHDHVMRDFREVCEALEITAPNFGASYVDSTGRTLPMYALPKDLTTTLVSGYSIPMRHAIVKRWLELEAVPQGDNRIPTSFREALLLAAAQQEQLEEANAQLAKNSHRRPLQVNP